MTTLADKAILSGANNRPPMLEKDMYDSWKSIMELYMMNRQDGRMILESVENGPLIWPTIEENGVTRPKKYSELSATKTIQADCDIKATNIILQGLPPKVYALVMIILMPSNHIDVFLALAVVTLPVIPSSPITTQANMVQILHEEELTFLADPGIVEGQATHTIITHNAGYQVDDFDAYDSDCDELNTAKVALMARICSHHYGDAHMIESQQEAIQNSNSSTQQDALIYLKAQQLEQLLWMKRKSNILHQSNYAVLNQLSPSFDSQFVPQTELSAEQAFWSQNSVNSPYPTLSSRPTKVEVPKELPKVSMVIQIVLWYLDSGCSKHMTGDRSQLTNFVNKFLGTIKFRNDHMAKILGYGDYQIGNVTISRIYYVEGLGHNLFFVRQFCNNLYTLSLGDMMASSPICLLLKASKTKSWLWHRRLSYLNFGKSKKKPHKPKSEDTNQEKLYLLHMDLCGPMRVASVNGKKYILVIVYDYIIRLGMLRYQGFTTDMMVPSPICLLSKASKTKSWLWHRRLSHLNFGAINHLARHGLVRGLPKLKFEKDHLCSACAMGKSKKKPHKPKSKDTNQEKLYLLHMDLYGPMRVASVNGKKYILVIVDDYSRFTWVKCLRSKDEAPDFIIKFLKMIQVRLKVPVRRIRTDNGTEFVNQTLREYYEKVGISHETSVARSPQQNGVVERRNHTLIEAARTMLIYAKAPLFLWAEAVATACYTQNRSIIRLRHGKTPYELLHDKLPDLSFFHVFGALCYLKNNSENLGKLQPKADIGIFIVMHPQRKHSKFTTTYQTNPLRQLNSRLVPNPPPSTPFVPPSRTDWDILFQLLFDKLLTPPPSVDHPAPKVIAPIADVVAPEPAASTGSPSSTIVDQDAPSPSNSQTTPKINLLSFLTMFERRQLFLWAEAVATACYTQNRSIVRLRHGKTPYELLHDKPPDLSFFHVFGALCYLTNNSENLGKLQPKAGIDFDELTVMVSEHSSSGPVLHEMTPATISSGLVPNPPPSTPFVPHSRSDWDLLFQSLFDKLLTPLPSVDYPAPEVVAPIHEVVAPVPAVSTGSHSSINVNQDAPSPSNSQTTPETQPPVIPNDVEEDNHEIKVAHMGNDPYFGILILEVHSDQSSSSDIIYTIVHPDHQIFEHNSKWTKDHPLENIICELARPISTRMQLHEQALFCYYDAFLTAVEPKTYKDAWTQSC
ncbi:retrovirus-related pol polyprotein from transposon TNT 1-94 [Tanacetum coccineum]|uniref:Retrovirus-related pol polyprotein from transposon TNT 1-94 n=1 Tax=Tanacetum coccineum TaxID=301880 RepID=A0ABQ5B959_9ASTR